MIPTLETARLTLRPCRAEDVDRLHALWCEPEVRRYLWDDRIIDRQEAAEVVAALVDGAEKHGCGLWLLYPLSGGSLVGFCALREIAGTSEVELLYGLARADWGQGFATEASRAVLEHGFDSIELVRIWARTDPPNGASLRVIEKLGMRPAENPGSETLPIVAFVLDRPA